MLVEPSDRRYVLLEQDISYKRSGPRRTLCTEASKSARNNIDRADGPLIAQVDD